jgi:ABC-type cobalamin transport system permease subunit
MSQLCMLCRLVLLLCAGDLALLYESWWKTRRSIIWTIAPDRREQEKKLLFDR